jgi:hypothetical protein
MATRRPFSPALVWMAVAAITLGVLVAYWPGVMRPDSFDQYEQGITGRYTDWHPAVLGWLWAVMDPWRVGPAPMFLLHLALFALGTGLLAEGLLRGGRPLAAVLVLAAALLPIPLGYLGVLMKDTTLAVALLAAFGLVGRFHLAGERLPLWAALAAAALAAFAAMLRFNAPFAVVPALLCLWPWLRAQAWPLRAAVGVAAVAAALALVPLANRAIFNPAPSGVALSPIIYDLGGITFHSGEDRFPPLGIPDFVAQNRQVCYSAFWWDNYGFGDCRAVFDRMKALAEAGEISPVALWLRAVLGDPLAYARHRIGHLNMNLRFLLPVAMEDVTFIANSANARGFVFEPNALTLMIRRAGLLQASTPLGWPAFWVAVALGWLVAAPHLAPGPARLMLVALSLSAASYAASYVVFSVASDLRYHLWTMIAVAAASGIGLAETWRAGAPAWTRLALGMLPAAAVGALGFAWRLWDLPAL